MATKVAIEVDVKTGDASDEIISLREELEKVKQTQKEMGDQFKAGFEAAEKGAKGASKGMKGFGGSIVSVIKSLGKIGGVLAVFQFMKDIIMKNQKVADALGVAFKTIEILMNELFKAIEPVGKILKKAGWFRSSIPVMGPHRYMVMVVVLVSIKMETVLCPHLIKGFVKLFHSSCIPIGISRMAKMRTKMISKPVKNKKKIPCFTSQIKFWPLFGQLKG